MSGHRCSVCHRFCGDVKVRANDERMTEATGVCSQHGRVDLSSESWLWDRYVWDEA